MKNEVFNADCLEKMKDIPDKSVDMILCDLPYGTTELKWDTVIPLEPLWKEYKRIIKPNGVIALFGKQPFTSLLVQSNIKDFKYEIIWEKEQGVDFLQVNKKPMNIHENISIFYAKKPTYNRIDDDGHKPYKHRGGRLLSANKTNASGDIVLSETISNGTRVATTVRKYSRDNTKGKGTNLHPTQKPVALLEWLIKSYTNEGETVLDNTMGSGSTVIACINTNRAYIGIEKDPDIFKVADERIKKHLEAMQGDR